MHHMYLNDKNLRKKSCLRSPNSTQKHLFEKCFVKYTLKIKIFSIIYYQGIYLKQVGYIFTLSLTLSLKFNVLKQSIKIPCQTRK